jgi:hypothetical protein
MEKKKTTIRECLELKVEIIGLNQGDKPFKGLINEKTSFKTKYWLHKILDKVVSEEKTFNKLRDDIIRKYGTEENGSFTVKQQIDGVDNPDYVKFYNEVIDLLNQEIEIEFPEIAMDSLDFQSEFVYPVFMKYIVVDNETVTL